MDASYECLQLSRSGPALTVTIDNPSSPVNAVNEVMHRELGLLFSRLKQEAEARVVILTGSKRAFSAGGDLVWMAEVTPETLRGLRQEGKHLLWEALEVELPIVAALNGPAVGLGATLALLCDVIVMADTATIADPHIKVGLVAGDGGAVLWPMLLGTQRAKRYLLTGDAIDAQEAVAMGIATDAVSPDQLMERAMEWAERLAANAPLAVQYTKLAVNQLLKQGMVTAFDYSTALELLTFVSADHREALESMKARRSPQFEGR
jgi:enoyl-CoA hydratase